MNDNFEVCVTSLEELVAEKTCRRCLQVKPLDDFYQHKLTNDGRNSWCKACSKEDAAERAKGDPKRFQLYRKNYDKRNASKVAEKREEWRKANRDHVNQKRRERWAAYPGGREAQKANRARKQLSPKQRLNVAVRAGVYDALKGRKSGRKWEQLVGYTLAELVSWLEFRMLPGMSWENYGRWHVDHVVPVSAFKFETADDVGFKACWKLTNLRPLWAPDNQSKGGRCQPDIAEALTILARISKRPSE